MNNQKNNQTNNEWKKSDAPARKNQKSLNKNQVDFALLHPSNFESLPEDVLENYKTLYRVMPYYKPIIAIHNEMKNQRGRGYYYININDEQMHYTGSVNGGAFALEKRPEVLSFKRIKTYLPEELKGLKNVIEDGIKFDLETNQDIVKYNIYKEFGVLVELTDAYA